jgi:hypothetical protein
MTECTQTSFQFHPLHRPEVVAHSDGSDITTAAGVVVATGQSETATLQLASRLAACFTDYRGQDKIEHGVRDLVAQRVYGLALGYEDLNDHD